MGRCQLPCRLRPPWDISSSWTWAGAREGRVARNRQQDRVVKPGRWRDGPLETRWEESRGVRMGLRGARAAQTGEERVPRRTSGSVHCTSRREGPTQDFRERTRHKQEKRGPHAETSGESPSLCLSPARNLPLSRSDVCICSAG